MKTLLQNTYFAMMMMALLITNLAVAQDNPANRPSPPATATGKINTATIMIEYGSPSVKGRTIWGELVPYGKIWRAGANEATTLSTDKEIKVEGKVLPAGKYSLFAIPNKDEWVIIFNKAANQWGAYNYDAAQDALRVTVKPRKSETMNERLVYVITEQGFVLRWENLEVPVSIK